MTQAQVPSKIAGMIEPQPASTVMIARDAGSDIEVFLVRRSARSAFMPDVFVFPGGRVEPQDRTLHAAEQLSGVTNRVEQALVYAAVRETFEEAGLLFASRRLDADALEAARRRLLTGTQTFARVLTELQTTVDASALRYFSRWITPPGESRRFDTHFFVARLPAGQFAQADALETHDGVWIAPREALARYAGGAFALIFPTVKHLERLGAFSSVAMLLEYAEQKAIVPVMPAAAADQQFRMPSGLEGIW